MLLRFPCGGIVRCNGRFDGGQQAEATGLHDSRRPAFHDQGKDHQLIALHRLHNPKWRSSVERFAVQRRSRRTNGSLMLHQCPCGGFVRCNGLFDSRATKPRNFSDQAVPISRQRQRFRDLSRADVPRSLVASPDRRADVRWPTPVRRPSHSSRTPMTNLRGTSHHHRLTVERLAVQRRTAVCGRPSAATAC
jgi:hypothetical protein